MLLDWESEKNTADMIFYTDQRDTPIFCTNTDELGFVREGVVGERKNPKMRVGWQVFSVFNQIFEGRLKFVSPCRKCLSRVIFPQED